MKGSITEYGIRRADRSKELPIDGLRLRSPNSALFNPILSQTLSPPPESRVTPIMPLRIDAHHHLWNLREPFDYCWLDNPDLAAIRRDFLPANLAPLLQSAGIDKTVVVQTQHRLAENDWALGLADEHPWIAGVVGWLDLASPDCESQLLEARRHPKFVGVRHVTQDEPDDDFIVSEPVLRGLEVLQAHRVPFDLLFYVKHLHHVPALVAQVPDLPMVIDHLAKPGSASRSPRIGFRISGRRRLIPGSTASSRA